AFNNFIRGLGPDCPGRETRDRFCEVLNNKKLWRIMMGNRRLSNLEYYILGVLLLLFAPNLSAQDTVSGSVADEETGEVLPGVNIMVKGTSSGTTSGSNGGFELTVP